jgi:ABC-2 type transport system ATP-binding protein
VPTRLSDAAVEDVADLVRVSGLTKRYARVSVLEDVSFSIRRGEVLGLIGPNGSGKTTLFECVAGLLPRDGGSIHDGVGRRIPRSDRSEHLFYLPDGIGPWPHETVKWALDFAVHFFGGSSGQVGRVIAELDLGSLLDMRMGALSKGQRKRALLGVGLIMPQPLLLADEPFDGLDLRQTRDVARAMRTHAAQGRTLFLSIHQIADAARVCDRFVLLGEGRVRGIGTLDQLKAVAAARRDMPPGGSLEEIFLALT